MTFDRSERKYVEILRILREHQDPVGAKRLSELMAERGFVLSDRAVQYYLQYLDEIGFTHKVGNRGRILTQTGKAETEQALVDERIGFIISKLERLAFRSTYDPVTGTGDVAYNLSIVPDDQAEGVREAFDEVLKAGLGFCSSYRIVDRDPRVPPGHTGFLTVCSITLDGVLQSHGIPVKMAFGGTLSIRDFQPAVFEDLIGYRGTTADPLQLFIAAGLTSVGRVVQTGSGTALVNIREVPVSAQSRVEEISVLMQEAGFIFPVTMGTKVFNLTVPPYRLGIVAFSGMNFIARSIEAGYSIRTEIGAGNIPYAKVTE
jgi:repressor of nif and glnA expression